MYGYVKQTKDGNEYVDWKKAGAINWADKAVLEKSDMMITAPMAANAEFSKVSGKFRSGDLYDNIRFYFI